MSEKGFGQELADELFCKLVVLGPPIVGGILMGPPGAAVAAIATAAIVGSIGSNSSNSSSSSSDGSVPKTGQ